MGVLYSVFPIDSDMVAYLTQCGVANPHGRGATRNPTPAEVRSAVQGIPAITADLNESASGELLQIALTAPDPDTGPWTLLNIEDYRSEDEPCRIWFEKGWPELILEVLIRITHDTGPLVIVPDTGDAPLVVAPDSVVSDLISTWKHTKAYDPKGPH